MSYNYNFQGMKITNETNVNIPRNIVEGILFTGAETQTNTPALDYNLKSIAVPIGDIKISDVIIKEINDKRLLFEVIISNRSSNLPWQDVEKDIRFIPTDKTHYKSYKINIKGTN